MHVISEVSDVFLWGSGFKVAYFDKLNTVNLSEATQSSAEGSFEIVTKLVSEIVSSSHWE